jgi:eukaryotic-like serine/threonine-protein kinase
MIGQHVQNYTITSYLGEGGMGTVYRASDTMLGRDVALKMLHGTLISQPQFLDRFKKEARILAQLLHPNIAVIYNFIGQDNNHFMVMEYVEGNNLDTLLRQYKQIPYEMVVPIFLQVLEGLHHAHKKRIFHRDIKPSNLILTPDGTVKLMDFGIAKVAGEQRLTQVNRVVGTIEYMPPELIEGKEPSVASDIYAAGVTMYELLTGKLPFESTTDYTLMQEIIKKKPVSVNKLNPAVPSALSNILMKALEKKPESRFADAKAFQYALSNAFPGLKEIDLRDAYKPAVAITEKVQVVTQPKTKSRPASSQTKDSNDKIKPFAFIQTIGKKIRVTQNAPVLIGIVSLLLAAVVALTMFNKKTNADNEITHSLTQYETAKPKEKKEEINTAVIPVSRDTAVNNIAAIPSRNDRPVTKDKFAFESADEKKKDEKKKDPSGIGIKKQTDKPEPAVKEEKKETPPVALIAEKKEEIKIPEESERKTPHTVRLNTRLDVNLYLRDAINEATAKEGQSLYFTVSNPVSYNGEVIIARGASASGRIKNIGKKKISIVLNSVTATSGQTLPFETVELSGRIEEIISSRNYSGTLKKGTTIHF